MAYYDNLTLEKGMYRSGGQGFTQALDELDPSGAYQGTGLQGLDAFERQLKRFNIKVGGGSSDCVEKFFQSSQTATLFPEYVRRSVALGVKDASILQDLIAANTAIDAMDYRPLASIPSEEDKSLKRVAEGAQIPSTQIRVQDHLVRLYKRGRVLVSSYEALRFERLDLFTVTLRQIGAWIARSQLNDAVKVLIEGDGNQNPAKVIPTAGADAITYDDLLGLWGEFQDYEMNRLVAAPDVMQKLLGIAEFRDPLTGLNFQGTGRLSTPMGAALYRAAGVPEGMLVALDKSCALEMVTAAEVSVEYDKLIDRQLERAAITSVAGFAKIFPDAVRVLKVKSGAGA